MLLFALLHYQARRRCLPERHLGEAGDPQTATKWLTVTRQ